MHDMGEDRKNMTLFFKKSVKQPLSHKSTIDRKYTQKGIGEIKKKGLSGNPEPP
jgi:hypothetical protein